ncbi:MAG: heavy metal-associated domain-containing protein [Planctomycetota bacterium]|nr:heavy metal-associated domain-containing protein [Planctomycetota bacterium]
MQTTLFVLLVLFRMALSSSAAADDKPAETPATFKHQITGLFSPDRVDDLKETMKHIPEIELVKVDYEKAEATFRYEPAKAFAGTKPEQIVERFDQILRNESNHTFGVKPLCELPADKLTTVEITVGGLDCKGCAFGAYDSIYRLPGVERATVSFKKGQLKAVINPEKVDRIELETALKQRGVEIKPK